MFIYFYHVRAPAYYLLICNLEMSAFKEEELKYRRLEHKMMKEEHQAKMELIMLKIRRESLEIERLLASKKGLLSKISLFFQFLHRMRI